MEFHYKCVENEKEAKDFLNISGELMLKIKTGAVDIDADARGSYMNEASEYESHSELLISLKVETVSDHSISV